MDELIRQLRKHGTVHVGSMSKAIRLVKEAAEQGYTFGRRQTVMGVLVIDLDD